MTRRPIATLLGAVTMAAATLLPSTAASADGPTTTTSTFTVTLADALADYAADPGNAWDFCDGFDIVAAFTVTRTSRLFDDGHEQRHVSFTGALYRADDVSIPAITYSGTFNRTLSADGTQLMLAGRASTAWIDGKPVQLATGLDLVTFDADGRFVSDVNHGPHLFSGPVCAALAG